MTVSFDLVKYMLDLAIGADQERGPLNAHRRLAIHILFLDHVVGRADLLINIGKQGYREAILLFELLLLLWSIGRNAQNHRIDFLELGKAFAKLASFGGSARGVGFWEEVEDNVLSAIIFKRYLLPVFVKKSKIRSLTVGFEHLSIASTGSPIAP